jgi:hypothetical protein
MKREMQGYPARAGHSAVISVFSSAFAFGFFGVLKAECRGRGGMRARMRLFSCVR